jgi:hypothetical protein
MADFFVTDPKETVFAADKKNGRPYLGRMPVFNAVALLEVYLCTLGARFFHVALVSESKQFLLS